MSLGEACPQAERAALKAIQLDDSLAEPHDSLGKNRMFCHWDWRGAEKELVRAIELNPSYAEAHHDYAFLLVRRGRGQEGIIEMKKALENDPMSTAFKQDLAWMFYATRQYQPADDEYRKILAFLPRNTDVRGGLAEVCLRQGKVAEAIAQYQLALESSPDDAEMVAGLASAQAVAGKRNEALLLLDRLEAMAKHQPVPATWRAFVYAGLGDKQQALAWLEKALEHRERLLLDLKVNPAYDGLRDEPRFQNLQRRVGLP